MENFEANENIESPFKKSGNFLARFAHQVGERLPIPYHAETIPAETTASQNILRRFTSRFAIVGGDILREQSPKALESNTNQVAEAIQNEGLADEDTVIELRAIMPEEGLYEVSAIRRCIEAMEKIRTDLAENDISAIYNSHPVMPTKSRDARPSPHRVWESISSELDAYEHQMRLDSSRRSLAVLALTDTLYAESIFKGQVYFEPESLKDNQVMVLRHVGENPRDNLLLPYHLNGHHHVEVAAIHVEQDARQEQYV